MPKHTVYVSGKGEGTSRREYMEVLTALIEAKYDGTGIPVDKLMKDLDASEDFIMKLVSEMEGDEYAYYNTLTGMVYYARDMTAWKTYLEGKTKPNGFIK